MKISHHWHPIFKALLKGVAEREPVTRRREGVGSCRSLRFFFGLLFDASLKLYLSPSLCKFSFIIHA